MDYAQGLRLLEAYASARMTFDGDGLVALFGNEAEYHEDPFTSPLVGHNALRAWLLDAAGQQRDVDFTVERHWVSGTSVLAAWHLSFVRTVDGTFVRRAGFLVAETASDGRIDRFRQWSEAAPTD